MPTVDVKVSYLEMLPPFEQVDSSLRKDCTVVCAQRPTVRFYRFLYTGVGEEYHWYSRGSLSDEKLASAIAHPQNEVHVLYVEGTPAGFTELDRRVENEVELIQFGLMPEFLGQGLGKAFLRWTIATVAGYEPKRFWLHTCSLDHPAALPNYLKAGFTLYKEEWIQEDL